MQLTYQFSAQVTFSGMRIYAGQGESGQIAVRRISCPVHRPPPAAAGVLDCSGYRDRHDRLPDGAGGPEYAAGPTGFSVDVDTVENPSAPLTGQLRTTDFMTFQIPGFAGTGAASESVCTRCARHPEAVLAGTVVFDVNYRLAAGAQIAGMDIDGNVTRRPYPPIHRDRATLMP
jgi:hypothetical protein